MDTYMVEARSNTEVRLSVASVRGDYFQIINLVHKLYSIVCSTPEPNLTARLVRNMEQLGTDYSLFHHICNIFTWMYRTQFGTDWLAPICKDNYHRLIQACIALEVRPVELERKFSL